MAKAPKPKSAKPSKGKGAFPGAAPPFGKKGK